MLYTEERTWKLWQDLKRQVGKVAIVLIGAPEVDPQARNSLIDISEAGGESQLVNKIAADESDEEEDQFDNFDEAG